MWNFRILYIVPQIVSFAEPNENIVNIMTHSETIVCNFNTTPEK
jgi:hypothetical protein